MLTAEDGLHDDIPEDILTSLTTLTEEEQYYIRHVFGDAFRKGGWR